MKERLSKIVAIFLAFVVLVSTTSFTVDMHYCGDFLVDTGVFSKAEKCGMEEETSSGTTSEFKKTCCSNQKIVIDGQEELRVHTVDISIDKQQLIAIAFVASYINHFEGYNQHYFSNKYYAPPKLIENTRILNQVFRI